MDTTTGDLDRWFRRDWDELRLEASLRSSATTVVVMI